MQIVEIEPIKKTNKILQNVKFIKNLCFYNKFNMTSNWQTLAQYVGKKFG